MASPYAATIAHHVAIVFRYAPTAATVRHVEAFMRLEHGTLAGLDAAAFRRAAVAGMDALFLEGEEIGEQIAESFGLFADAR